MTRYQSEIAKCLSQGEELVAAIDKMPAQPPSTEEFIDTVMDMGKLWDDCGLTAISIVPGTDLVRRLQGEYVNSVVARQRSFTRLLNDSLSSLLDDARGPDIDSNGYKRLINDMVQFKKEYETIKTKWLAGLRQACDEHNVAISLP